ncbi:unnamed protein product, partial [Thlaspi arvense]
MSATDIVAISASANYVTFDDLRLGRSTQQVVGRLLRYWDARNIKKNGEFMGIVLLILDEKGFIPAGRADQFRQLLREDAVFNIGRFEVGRCINLYRITDHPFVIRFLPATTIVEMHDVSPTIKHERFMLRNIDHLQALANTNLELPDVVGQIQFVQGSNLDDPTSTQRLVVRFRVDTSVVVYLSLWDDAAATFRAHLTTGDTMHSVMVVTTINPKLFGGNLYLNSTPATRFYFDSNIHAIQQLTTSRIESLPQDLLGLIVCKVGADSPVDYHNCILSCKELRASSTDKRVCQKLSLAPLLKKPIAANNYHTKYLAQLKWADDITTVDMCWENLKVALHGIRVIRKKGYVKSLNKMTPTIYCHRDDMDNTCAKCFYYKQMYKFVYMM